MDENNRTDKDILAKGIKQLVICLVLMFAAPSFLYFILNNKDKPFFTILLIIAIVLCILAIVFLFLGINTIMDSLFKKKKNK